MLPRPVSSAALLLWLVAGMTAAQSAPLVNPTTGHSYLLSPTLGDVATARAFAQSVGGHLVTIESAAEQAWLAATFPGNHWIGLSDETSEGTFVWDDGQALSYANWGPGQPDDQSPLCGNADYVWSVGGVWHDVSLQCALTPLLRGIVEIPVLDIGLVSGSLAVNPSAPAVGQSATLSVNARNFGQMPVSARVSFHAGNPSFGGALIGQVMLVLPFGVTPVAVPWLAATLGSTSLFATVENLSFTGGSTANDRLSISVAVGSPADQLTVEAGAVDAWPGAVVQTPVTVRNTGSAATTLQAVAVLSPWATVPPQLANAVLAPGQLVSGLVTISVPSGTVGSPPGSLPTIYDLPVAATSPVNTFSDDLVVRMFDQPTSQVTVLVRDAQTMLPIPAASVAVSDVPGLLTTNGSGEVLLPLTAGPRSFFAYHPSYVATAISAVVAAGATTVALDLDPGATLQVQSVTAVMLSTAEIIARGVNVNDPVNNVIVDFVVTLTIGPFQNPPAPIVLPNVEVPMNPQPGTTYSVGGYCYCGGGSTGSGGGFSGGGGASPAGAGGGGSVWVGGQVTVTPYGTSETWIVIPGSVTILKQFYEVLALVVNNAVAPAPSDVQLENVAVTLALPFGLGLPDLFAVPQTPTQTFGTLDAGESVAASWIVRGDAPGTYALTGSSSADLVAFATPVAPVTASLTAAPFDVVLPRIRLDFVVPQAVFTGVPFIFGVLVTNEQIVDAQLVRVALDVANLVNCTVDPVQPMRTMTELDQGGAIIGVLAVLGDIAPGESAYAEFSLIPTVSGVVTDAEVQVWSDQIPTPSATVSPNYPGNGGDLIFLSGANAPPNDVPIKIVHPGETLVARFESPNGTLVGAPLTMVGQFKDTIDFANLPVPGLWVDAGFFFFVNGLPGSPMPPLPVSASGIQFSTPIPPFVAGSEILVQGLAFFPSNPASLGLTAAHEFRIQF